VLYPATTDRIKTVHVKTVKTYPQGSNVVEEADNDYEYEKVVQNEAIVNRDFERIAEGGMEQLAMVEWWLRHAVRYLNSFLAAARPR
jgi:hypothetical protein